MTPEEMREIRTQKQYQEHLDMIDTLMNANPSPILIRVHYSKH